MIPTLQAALDARGYSTLTDVQQAVTEPELGNSDLLVSAQTGSGKTVGFGLAIAPTLLDGAEIFGKPDLPQALVIAPTRELAMQVKRELDWLYASAGARISSCVGGMDIRDERRALARGTHIVVGTPGRLRDHIEKGALQLGELRAVVLDEADEMLDMGFREDLEFMLGESPEERRTLMFSATVSPMIAKLAEKYQRSAKRISTISKGSQHTDIQYQVVQVAQSDVEHGIINLLRFHDAEKAIVFANTRAAVARLTARLANRGLSVVSLSGELSQSERTHALQAMRDGRARICVATDVAARGIDLPKLELVIHADLPSNTEALLHRSGRTGRAGQKGISALIVTPKIGKKASRLLQWAKLKAEWGAAPSPEEIRAKDEERLLESPLWTDEITEAQEAFAAKLLEQHSPERIAAAFFALAQSKLSAPEELRDPEARPERKERTPFGPSTWIALSVGRGDRAEPRWLLPMLCRVGGLDKEQIGYIKVAQKETYVQLAEASVAGFMSKLTDDVLQDDIKVRKMDEPPELPDRNARGPRPDRGDRPDRGPRQDRGEHGDRPNRGPRPDRGDRPDRGPRPDRGDRPDRGPRPDRGDRPDRGPKPDRDTPREDRSEGAVPKPSSFRAKKFDGPSDEDRGARKPRHSGKPGAGARPDGEAFKQRKSKGDFGGDRPKGKKPGGKPGGKGAPAAASPGKRLGPPRKGGDARPTRRK